MPLLLTEADVRAVLSMRDLIATMETALGQFSTGGVVQPLRTVLDVQRKGFFAVMPASAGTPPALGAKLVTVFHGNTARGLPTHLASIALLDPETGALQALMDGRYITEARTAAVSAVSTRHLANPAREVTLAIVGSGVQARSHLEAMAEVRTLREVRVWSPTPQHRDRFVADMEPHVTAPIEAAPDAEAAVRGADLIVVATSSAAPVVRNDWVADGAHLVTVGACRPDQRELEASLVARSRLFVDSRTGALTEAGDIVLSITEGRIAPDHIRGELGEVVAGRVAGRTGARDVTFFKSLGMAVEDVAAARLAYTRALERGIGTAWEL